jgi:D-lactate dehydrogenase
MLTASYQELIDKLSVTIDFKRIITNPLQTLAYGTDASFYRLIPKIVILAQRESEVIEIIKQAKALDIALTFRAAGTSLSGQAITDSVLVVATQGWKNHELLNNNEKIKLEPGVIGAKANLLLAPFGLKIGPDPASIGAAMIGGIVANNASGMCCGTAQNSYKTICDIRIVMYDGTVLDTASLESIRMFKNSHKSLIQGIETLRDEIKNNEGLYNRIKNKFKIKNTTGYSINSLIDFEDPIEIIKHLMVGSEGTLAFISNVTFKTVIDEKYKSCSLVIFNTIQEACNATILLKSSPVAAVELLDRESIRSVENDPDAPEYFKKLPESSCALLIECRDNDLEILNQKQVDIRSRIISIATFSDYEFTSDPKKYYFNWKARKGLLPTVGAIRKNGTTVIIEDVAFPLPELADACLALKDLFKKHNYHDAVLFGHALEGNLHFVFSQDFTTQTEVDRYENLMSELATLVVDQFNGSLKAEHGTGRNMSPFVEKEWGTEAYEIMKRIKNIFDPFNKINPDVLINPDPKAHLKNLKPLPIANDSIDKCIECGFCEPNCVSEGLTLSPRQRIVIAREISRLQQTNEDPVRLAQMLKDSIYMLDETCAVDGLCAMACPVNIDTGKFVKNWRSEHISKNQKKLAASISRNIDTTTSGLRTALNIVGAFQSLLGNKTMSSISSTITSISEDKIPKWDPSMPKGSVKIKNNMDFLDTELKVVYFPSCINRTMGKSDLYDKQDPVLIDKTQELLKRAGFGIIYPEDINNLCCGMPFSSKGFVQAALEKSNELEEKLMKISQNGKFPILYDMSPCFYASKESLNPILKIIDPIEFMLDQVMPRLKVKNKRKTITVFPVCSTKKIGMTEKLVALSQLCAEKVTIIESNCCGFAGDRGFTVPELNEHGQKELKKQIPSDCNEGYSTSRTCEIGLEKHSGINFKSIFYLVDEVTK